MRFLQIGGPYVDRWIRGSERGGFWWRISWYLILFDIYCLIGNLRIDFTEDCLSNSVLTGHHLRAWRLTLGWTQETASERLGVPLPMLRLYEQGINRLPPWIWLLCWLVAQRLAGSGGDPGVVGCVLPGQADLERDFGAWLSVIEAQHGESVYGVVGRPKMRSLGEPREPSGDAAPGRPSLFDFASIPPGESRFFQVDRLSIRSFGNAVRYWNRNRGAQFGMLLVRQMAGDDGIMGRMVLKGNARGVPEGILGPVVEPAAPGEES